MLPGCPSDEPEHGPESAGPILALEYDSTGAKENSRFVEKEMKRLQLLENQYKQRFVYFLIGEEGMDSLQGQDIFMYR